MRKLPWQLSHTGWFNIAAKSLSNKDRFNKKCNLIGCWLAVLWSWTRVAITAYCFGLAFPFFPQFFHTFQPIWQTRHIWTAWTLTLTFFLSLHADFTWTGATRASISEDQTTSEAMACRADTGSRTQALFCYHNHLLKGVHVLDLWHQPRVRRPRRVKITSEWWNSWMTLPCAFGLDDFYRQMRMSGSIKMLHNHTGFKPLGGVQRRCF